MKDTKHFTGVGSRQTPEPILQLMRGMSKKLCSLGWVLRSGGAEGADEYFERGWLDSNKESHTDLKAEIYLPWDNFNGKKIDEVNYLGYTQRQMMDAWYIVKEVHPAPGRLTGGAKALHIRNIFQVLGRDLNTPSKFVVGYAPVDSKGNPKGGTATAFRLAKDWGIPVFNLVYSEFKDRLQSFVENSLERSRIDFQESRLPRP